MSFLIGTLVLFVAAAVARGGLARIGHAGDVSSWIYLTGGVLGAGYVTCALLSVRTLGTGGVIATTIAGELIVAVLIDQFGWFGVDKQPIDATRVRRDRPAGARASCWSSGASGRAGRPRARGGR